MSRPVMNKTIAFHGLAVIKGGADWTLLYAHLAAGLIAMEKDAVDARVAQYIHPRITGNTFSPFAPEHYFLLQIENADPDLQGVENFAINLGILKCWHGFAE